MSGATKLVAGMNFSIAGDVLTLDRNFDGLADRVYALARGSIVLETGHGWIEDGPAIRLERLRAELDRMGAPQ